MMCMADPTSYESELAHYWWPNPQLWVVSLFGNPPLEAARRLTDRFTDNADAGVRHSTLFDVRGLVGVSPEPFNHLAHFVGEHRAHLESATDRVAIVLASTVADALSHGIVAMTRIRFPVETFDAPAPAFAWLGVDDPGAMAAEHEQRIERARSVLPELRAFLRRSPSASLDQAAAALAVSTRQLQRLLKKLDLSYRDERARVRVELAKKLLLTGDLKVEAVAAEVGYAKLQNFVDAFRKVTGETPGAWRDRREGEAAIALE
jgi:AraC-like DNA-binding protein